jgi:hypothetical protein
MGGTMELHTKQLGNLGESAVATDLIGQGYYVFTELGDICKADLLVMDEEYEPIKVQVKAISIRNGKIALKSSKAGPGYRFDYELKHAQVYAVYVPERKLILYISNKELLALSTLTIRIDPAKNKQIAGTNQASYYTDFKRALRDCTRDTLSINEGDETVQTNKPEKAA